MVIRVFFRGKIRKIVEFTVQFYKKNAQSKQQFYLIFLFFVCCIVQFFTQIVDLIVQFWLKNANYHGTHLRFWLFSFVKTK